MGVESVAAGATAGGHFKLPEVAGCVGNGITGQKSF